MVKEPWDYDRHSHRVILNVGRRQRRNITIAANLLNRPRVVVLIVIITVLIMLFLKEARSVLASNPQFIIRDIILENTNLITKDILKLEDNKGIFDISTREIVRTLGKDPDIESVVVEKILPGTLKIIINERLPYARLQEYLDASSRYYRDDASRQKGIPKGEKDFPTSAYVAPLERRGETAERHAGGNLVSPHEYLIDHKGIVLWRERPGVSVPTITGLKIKKLVPGDLCTVPELQNILDILHAGDNIGWGKFIEVNRVEFNDADSVSIYTRERISIRLRLDNINEQLDRLMFVLNDVQKKGRLIKVVDLRFKEVYVE